jgi:hypothetical protein
MGKKGMGEKMDDRADMKGEEYLRGRRAGVEETSGKEGKPYRGVNSKWSGNSAEATNLSKGEGDSGGNEELASTARSLYQDAVSGRGDRLGDKALTER